MEDKAAPSFRSTAENGNVYEEIEMSMRLAADDEEQIAEQPVQPSRKYIKAESHTNGISSEQADGNRAMFDSLPIDNTNHIGARESNEDKESSDIGLSLMRSALVSSAGSDITLEGIEEEHERYDLDVKDLTVEPIDERDSCSENSSDAVVNDILALYAKPDKTGNRTTSGSVESTSNLFRPKFIPSERLVEIPESEVSRLWDKNEEIEIGDDDGSSLNTREDTIISKDTETLLQASPVSWSNYPENTEPDQNLDSGRISPPKDGNEIVDLSELVRGIQIGEADEKSNDFGNDNEAMTLEELENIGADLEFEFEDEQEIVELDETDKDLPSLKFAPIHEQETAPSTPIVSQSGLNRDSKKADAEEGKPLGGDKARTVNIYEYESGMPRSFAFPGLSGNNRRQMFNVQNISATDLAGFDGFHSFSPRILTRVDMSNGSYLAKESTEPDKKGSDALVSRGVHVEENGTDQDKSIRMELNTGLDRGLSDDGMVTFPNRNLPNKRIPIISYRSDSPEKKQHGDSESAENSSQGLNNSENCESRSDLFAFHKLRNIFENEQPGTPRTEYLSEIIKKNNTEGRRRFKSSESLDENANEIGLKSSFVIREGLRRFKSSEGMDENADKSDLKSVEGEKHHSVVENGNNKKMHSYRSYNGSSRHSTTESDLSSFDDFDFSSSITKSMVSKTRVSSADLASYTR